MGLLSNKILTNSRLALPYLINTDNISLDYSRYISEPPKKTDTKNQPTKLEFTCIPIDNNFIKLTRGNYISFQSALYGSWFTGWIINDPELNIVGSQNGVGVYGYKYVAMSDEYLINLKPLGIIAPFFNMTLGQILSSLVEDLCPGMYDTSHIQDAILQPRYQIDPTDKFTDIVKSFCDQAQFIFYGKEGYLYFQPADQTAFAQVIDGNDRNFTPANLTLTPTSDPIINDCTVLGGVEPQATMTEYFAGDGFTGAYNLVNSPFGIDSTVLINDSFSGTSIDSTVWTLYDDSASYVQLSSGFVNVLGGQADGEFNVHLDSASPIFVEGQLKMTHGEWDFLAEGLSGANGVLGYICGLWTDTPSSNLNNCMYSLQVSNVDGVQIINPLINGLVDNTQSMIVDTVNRYVIRTSVSSSLPYRSVTGANYTNQAGTTINFDRQLTPATYQFTTLFTLLDITTGVLISQNTFSNVFESGGTENYALYVPFVSNDLHATFSMVTVDYPIQGVLQHYPPSGDIPPQLVGSTVAPVMGTYTGTYFDQITDTMLNHTAPGSTGMNLYWPLNEGGGSVAKDFSVQGGTATVATNGTWQGTKTNASYYALDDFDPTLTFYLSFAGNFNGTDNKITALNTYNFISNWTVCGWFSANSLIGANGNRQCLFSMGNDNGTDGTSFYIELQDINTGLINIGSSTDVFNLVSTGSPIIVGDWFSVIVTYTVSSNTLNLYVNGLLVGTATYSINVNEGSFIAGSYLTTLPFDRCFAGQIADIRVYKSALDANIVTDIFDAGRNPFTVEERWPRVLTSVYKTLGQNELDALDGTAPDATIADTITGANTSSSLLGTPQYNVASAALTYFKDSVALVATTPTQGTLISVQYNEAGVATGRVTNVTSINAEAAVWKDDGIRALVKTDCNPKPRTSDECEVAAAVLVGQNCFQHYEGTYKFISDFLTYKYEPISGSYLKFKNLPSVFPLVQSEEATEIVTTFDSRRPIERFSHQVNFGLIDRVQKLLAKYNQPTDVFAPTDSLEMPETVGLNQAATVFGKNVQNVKFNGMNPSYYFYTIRDIPSPQGGFEVRLSDDSWGSSNSKNLVTRLPYTSSNNYNFSLPRNSRSKVIYVRAFDGRNQLSYSEDFTQWTGVNSLVNNTMAPNPDDDYSVISNVYPYTNGSGFSIGAQTNYSFGSNSYPTATSNITATFTVDLKVPINKKIQITIEGNTTPGSAVLASKTFIGTGSWQRVSVVANNTTRNNTRSVYIKSNAGGTWAATFQVTRASFEEFTTQETLYCSTVGNPYGALSRFSTGVRVNFSLIPPAPSSVSVAVSGNLDTLNTITTGTGLTATITQIQQVGADGTPTENNPTISNPQITVNLPDIQIDIFGVEIRAADNTTVLYRQNLTSAGYSIAVSLGNTYSAREAEYNVYTYNVFGEYSAVASITASIPDPTVTGLSVDSSTQNIVWNGLASSGFNLFIADDSAFTTNVLTYAISATYNSTTYQAYTFYLQNSLYGVTKYIKVVPYDSIGNGAAATFMHVPPSGSTPINPIERPTSHTDTTTTTGSTADSQAATVYSMVSAYDSDNTTYGILQADSGSGSNPATATASSTFTGFISESITTGMMIYVTLSFAVNADTGAFGNTGYVNLTYTDTSSNPQVISLFSSDSSSAWQGGATFTVSATLPVGENINVMSVVCSCHASTNRVNLTGPGGGGTLLRKKITKFIPKRNDETGPLYTYDESIVTMNIYDVYIQ
jgi:hypothetical protein